MNTQDQKYQQKSKSISSAEPNYFVQFDMRYPALIFDNYMYDLSIINLFQIKNATSKKDEILEGRRKKALEETAEKYKELNLQECSSNLDLDDYCGSKDPNGSEKGSAKLDIRSGGLA